MRGGTILLEAGALTLTNGAMVLNHTSGVLPGGDILVRANALTLSTGSGMIAFTAPGSAGDAGNVRVEAQTVTIRDGSFISSATQGAGRGGNVTVTADTLVMDGSLGVSSQIATTSAPGSTGDAGSVRVEAQTVTLTNGAQIQSGTWVRARGNVTVIAQGSVTLDGFGRVMTAPGQTGVVPSQITASSQPGSTGDAGSVRVEAQTRDRHQWGTNTKWHLGCRARGQCHRHCPRRGHCRWLWGGGVKSDHSQQFATGTQVTREACGWRRKR